VPDDVIEELPAGVTVIGEFTSSAEFQWEPELPETTGIEESGYDHFN